MGTILAFDYGTVRVGVAIAVNATEPEPLVTLSNTSPDELLVQITHLMQAHSVTELVVGLPRNLEGEDTAQTALVRKFAQDLRTLDLPVHLQDEALTSEVADERLQNLAHNRQKSLRDQVAAQIILEDYLQTLENKHNNNHNNYNNQ